MSISVLCPTRRRPEALARSLASLHSTADGEFEVALAVDPDEDTRPLVPLLNIQRDFIFRTSERYGYERLHVYYNKLAAIARGDWLLLWNDDALMATPGWDRIVDGSYENVILSPHTVHDPLCTFPIVPRRFVEAIGHFSLNTHCDSWWQEIGEHLGILVWPDIRVDHRRFDLTGENGDGVFNERRYQTAEFNAMRPERIADAEKIRSQVLCVPS